MTRGRFFSFEGIEGAGKTTQIQLLAGTLRDAGHDVVRVREPGGTALGEDIRSILLRRDREPPVERAELLLYVAARAQLVAEVIRPALARGAVVLADRYGDASVAYQGGGRRLGFDWVRALNRWTTGNLRPDLTFLMDLDPTVGLARVRATRGAFDRMEAESIVFHRRVRAAYRRLSREEPRRLVLLDARRPPDELADEIRACVERMLARKSVRS